MRKPNSLRMNGVTQAVTKVTKKCHAILLVVARAGKTPDDNINWPFGPLFFASVILKFFFISFEGSCIGCILKSELLSHLKQRQRFSLIKYSAKQGKINFLYRFE